MRKRFSKKYKGLGFVESLIAIMVSGIVATVLINISALAMRELVRLDIEDAQAHHARSAAVVVQNIANRERARIAENPEETNIFYGLEETDCYRLVRDSGTGLYNFFSEFGTEPFPLEKDRDSYIENAKIDDGVNDDEGDYFRIVCIVNNTRADEQVENDTNKILIKVIIGFNKTEGIISNSSDIRDYQYFAVINL
jgi:hypothetical protein